MSIIKAIKNLFKKELSSIIAPLDKIHTKLDKFLDRVAVDISDNVKEINSLLDKNVLHEKEQQVAAKVKENIKNLIGKV